MEQVVVAHEPQESPDRVGRGRWRGGDGVSAILRRLLLARAVEVDPHHQLARREIEVGATHDAQLPRPHAREAERENDSPGLRLVVVVAGGGQVAELEDFGLAEGVEVLPALGLSGRRFVNGFAAATPSRTASADIVRATRLAARGQRLAIAVARSNRSRSPQPRPPEPAC